MTHDYVDDYGLCAQCALPESKHPARLSAMDWRQRISRALGVRPGQMTYTLDEAVSKIQELRGGK